MSMNNSENIKTGLMHFLMKLNSLVSRQLQDTRHKHANLYMLIYIAMQEEKKEDITFTSVCYVNDIPKTTAMRRIDDMVEHGMIETYSSKKDCRCVYIRMTKKGKEVLNKIMKSMQDITHSFLTDYGDKPKRDELYDKYNNYKNISLTSKLY